MYAFLKEHVRRVKGARLSSSELFALWKVWATSQQRRPGSQSDFNESLRGLVAGVIVKKSRRGNMEWRGLALKTDGDA